MEIFKQVYEFCALVPDWVALVVCPALVVALAVVLALFGGRKAYPVLAGILCTVGVALMIVRASATQTLFYGALFLALSCAAGLLLFLPRRQKKLRRTSRDERIYQRFHAELEGTPHAQGEAPEKVCCFEQSAPEQPAPELSYVMTMLEKLRREELSATDRLEADMLLHTVSAMQGRMLTEEEKNTLNDCLASILKLTAKYKL